MPTVILQGGLGNQLFQYAVGRSLSLATDSELYLETSAFTGSSPSVLPSRRPYLSHFHVQGEVVQHPLDESPLLKGRFKVFGLLSSAAPELAARICRVHRDLKDPHRFTPYVPRLPGNVFLYGYYQSEKYFSSIRTVLSEEFSLRSEPCGPNRKWMAQIENTRSVGVHVRRGDYTDQGWVLPTQYYREAIRAITRENDGVHLFFFSDEIEWVRENIEYLLPESFSSGRVNYVDCNESHGAHKDLRLMKSCSHTIISNSTFSWWGAWLNQNEEKTILAPGYWVRDRVENLDVIPNRWRVVDW